MHNRLSFVVHAVPVPQPRQRTRAFVDKTGRAVSHNYTPVKHPVNVFKCAVAEAFCLAYGGTPFYGPVRLELEFVMPRPKSMTKKRGPNPRVPDTRAKGDIDNLIKAVLDSLNGTAWRDDALVWEVTARKIVAAADEQPLVHVVFDAAIENSSLLLGNIGTMPPNTLIAG